MGSKAGQRKQQHNGLSDTDKQLLAYAEASDQPSEPTDSQGESSTAPQPASQGEGSADPQLASEGKGETLADTLAATGAKPQSTKTRKDLHAKTEKDAEKQAKKAAQEQERLKREQERKNQEKLSATQRAAQMVQNGTQPVVDRGRAAIDWTSSLQTVGGVGLLLVILVILVFTVVQVDSNGDTRLKQIWYMLNGRAGLSNPVKLQPVPDSASGPTIGGGDSGIPPGTPIQMLSDPVATSSFRGYTSL